MAAKITRTVTTYSAKAYKVAWKDGQPIASLIGGCEYMGGDSKTEARAALKNAGVAVPRGTEIVIEEVSSMLYEMPLEQFIALATPVIGDEQ